MKRATVMLLSRRQLRATCHGRNHTRPEHREDKSLLFLEFRKRTHTAKSSSGAVFCVEKSRVENNLLRKRWQKKQGLLPDLASVKAFMLSISGIFSKRTNLLLNFPLVRLPRFHHHILALTFHEISAVRKMPIITISISITLSSCSTSSIP